MQLPLQITFRHMDHSDAIEARIREEVETLEQFYDQIISCRVVVDAPHAHHHKGKLYHIGIDLKVPDAELVVSREHHEKHEHEDFYVAVRDAFADIRRQLEDYARRRRGKVKTHIVPPHGRISEIHPEGDYGKIETPDGREIYFHKNSLINETFEHTEPGMEVRFTEEQGERGPQASSVHVTGKHHVVG